MKLCLQCNLYFNDTETVCPNDQTELQSVGKDPLIGALISDRYVIESVIGKGSSGIVYKATRMQQGVVVAIKVLHSYLGADSGSLDRFLREAAAASKLRHQHIITIWDSGVTDDGLPFFVMDYLEGVTLSRLIKANGCLPINRALLIIRQIADALNEAHEQGIIHRDLKPENIILQETDSGEDYVKVLDFGIADSPADTPQLEKPKTVAGSPAYMSPEQCQGYPLDQRSDIYSFAIVIFEMLTGHRPVEGEDHVHMMFGHVNQPPKRLSDFCPQLNFPESLEQVLAKALAKSPSQRYENVLDFCINLEKAAREMPNAMHPPLQGEARISQKVPIVEDVEEATHMIKTQAMEPTAAAVPPTESLSAESPLAEDQPAKSQPVASQIDEAEEPKSEGSNPHHSKVRLTVSRTYDNSPLLTNHHRLVIAALIIALVISALFINQLIASFHKTPNVSGPAPGVNSQSTPQGPEQQNITQNNEAEAANAAHLTTAKTDFDAKKYEEAMAELDKIPANSSSFSEAANLFKQIRNARDQR